MGGEGGGVERHTPGWGERERKETVMEAEGRLSRPIHHGATRGSKSNRTWGRRGRGEDEEERRTEGGEEDLDGDGGR